MKLACDRQPVFSHRHTGRGPHYRPRGISRRLCRLRRQLEDVPCAYYLAKILEGATRENYERWQRRQEQDAAKSAFAINCSSLTIASGGSLSD
jgi:hypothetical protein